MLRLLPRLRIAQRQKRSIQAFSIAEAGIERALYELRQDFKNDFTDPSWADGTINAINCGSDTNNFYFLLNSIILGNGAYSIELKNVVGKDNEIWVRSTGSVGDISKAIQSYIRIIDVSIWQNAIFAGGGGAAGTVINGNVDIRGSVHILGMNLGDTDFAMDMSGNAMVGNNYNGMPLALKNKIPSCPTTTFNGETVESLGAVPRIKKGLAGLSGTATVGEPDVLGNVYKETLDGAYVTSGYAGEKGDSNAYSDNGTKNFYDLGDAVTFPSLQDPYLSYTTYQNYLEANALVISDLIQLNELANITPGSNFNYGNANGSISMDSATGNLNISGIVYIDGNLNFKKQGPKNTITYTGSASVLVTGNVGFDANVVTQGNNSFPNNIMGIMTPNTISFTSAQIDIMGLFYAENMINAQKQTDVVGSFASNYFNMGIDVPSIFQVPNIIDYIPAGMIGRDPVWFIDVVAWQKQ